MARFYTSRLIGCTKPGGLKYNLNKNMLLRFRINQVWPTFDALNKSRMNHFRTTLLTLFSIACLTTFGQPISELGQLANVEDAGYPFVVLTVDFPERQFSEYFELNLEEVKTLNSAALNNAIGKYIAFEYTSELFNVLLDLRHNGQSIFPESEVSVDRAGVKSITGILSNAAEETRGDQPDIIYIQTEEEYRAAFYFFITPEIVALNGKIVDGYFEERTLNKMTKLRITE